MPGIQNWDTAKNRGLDQLSLIRFIYNLVVAGAAV